MLVLSLFSGIEGFGLGFAPHGFRCVGRVEKDKTCQSVLRRHWPDDPIFPDVQDFNAGTISIRPDWICGGFPCQDLSVAGRRAGLAGKRSGLWWEFKRIVGEFLPAGVLIENVPGLRSSWSPTIDPPSGVPSRKERGRPVVLDETSDFDTVTRGLVELGYGWAMRELDAQWFGLAQRRKRVFIVGCLGSVRRAAEILFERESLPWDSPPSREAGTRLASCVRGGIESGSNESGNKLSVFQDAGASHWREGQPTLAQSDDNGTNQLVASPLCAGYAKGSGHNDGKKGSPQNLIVGSLAAHDKKHGHAMTTQQAAECGQLIAHTLRAEGHDASEDGTGRGVPLVAACLRSNVHNNSDPTMEAQMLVPVATMDMRQCSRGDKMANNRPGGSSGGAPGTGISDGELSPTICDTHTPAVAFQTRIARNGRGQPKETTDAPTSSEGGTHADSKPHVAYSGGVRRLTPRECERLQGFPDDWTRYGDDGKEISDSARYRMLGNAVPPPVVAWIAGRIAKKI